MTGLGEPLVYDRDAPVSYFRDLIFAKTRGDGAAAGRLERHAAQMAAVAVHADRQARRALGARGYEYRAAPATTDSNFAVPAWLIEDYATAPRPHRVLADLMPTFGLPAGVSSVNIPILSTGTVAHQTVSNMAAAGQDFVDTAGSSPVATIDGQADVALQLLEQSPAGAHLDWVIFKDLADAYDARLETVLVNGSGSSGRLKGAIPNASSATAFAYTDASPTAGEFYTACGQAAALVGDNRLLPPECWLMRTMRWSWLATSEDDQHRPFMPPGQASPAPLSEGGPRPVGSVAGWPVFADDAVPATLGAGANQDAALAVRPSDMLLFEGASRTAVMEDVLSGTLGVRLQLRGYVAALTGRYPSGIGTVTGTGMVVPSGY